MFFSFPFRTKSQLLLDLNISDKTSLNLMGNGECTTAEKQVGSENKPTPESKNNLLTSLCFGISFKVCLIKE